MTTKAEKNSQALFAVYCVAGGNVAEAHGLAVRKGINLTLKTFHAWAKKYNYSDRMKAVDQKNVDQERGIIETADSLLKKRIAAYEDLFERELGGKLDHQATYAFNALVTEVKSLAKVELELLNAKHENPDAPTVKEIREAALKVFRDEYGVDLENSSHVPTYVPRLEQQDDEFHKVRGEHIAQDLKDKMHAEAIQINVLWDMREIDHKLALYDEKRREDKRESMRLDAAQADKFQRASRSSGGAIQ